MKPSVIKWLFLISLSIFILEAHFLGKLGGWGEEEAWASLYKERRNHFQLAQHWNFEGLEDAGIKCDCMSFASNKFLFLLSVVAVIQSIPIFNETGRFSFTLPYPVKIKVRFSFFLQIYIIVIFLGKYWLYNRLFPVTSLEGRVKCLNILKVFRVISKGVVQS